MKQKKGLLSKIKEKSLIWIGLQITPQEKARITKRIKAEEIEALKEFHKQKRLKRVL